MTKSRKLTILLGAYIIVFIMTVLITSWWLNKDLKTQVVKTTTERIPEIYMEYEGNAINYTNGFVTNVDSGHMREHLTPIAGDKSLIFRIDEKDPQIESVQYILRDESNDLLVEEQENVGLPENLSQSGIKVKFNNVLEEGQEYCLTLVVKYKDQETFFYPLRVVYLENFNAKEYLSFSRTFLENSLSKDKVSENMTYMETSSLNTNESFTNVNINSNQEMLSFGQLNPIIGQDIVANIHEIEGSIVSISYRYQITSKDDHSQDDHSQDYHVHENYRLQKTTDRMYLLGFERSLAEKSSESSFELKNQMMHLGIMNANEIQHMKNSAENSYHAFVKDNQLWGYQYDDNILTEIYSTNQQYNNARKEDVKQNITVLKVADNGDVYFLTHGYIYEGSHKGAVGTILYQYTPKDNVLNEVLYLKSNKTSSMLNYEMKRLSFLEGEYLYLIENDTVYRVSLKNQKITVAIEGLTEGRYDISADGKYILKMTEDEKSLLLVELSTGEQRSIAYHDQKLYSYGFYDGDIVYGIVDEKSSRENESIFVSDIFIVNEHLQEVKAYHAKDNLIADVNFTDVAIEMMVVKKDAENLLDKANYRQESLLNNKDKETKTEDLVVVKDPIKQNQYWLNIKATEAKLPIIQEARIIENSDIKEVSLPYDIYNATRYYEVYRYGELQGEYRTVAAAVLVADAQKGTVVDSAKHVLWKPSGKQIDQRINVEGLPSESYDLRNAIYNAVGDRPVEFSGQILEDLKRGLSKEVADLSGLDLNQVLYFVSEGNPVIAKESADKYVLIIGYKPNYIVVSDPETGKISDWNIDTYKETFQNQGNVFYTYY